MSVCTVLPWIYCGLMHSIIYYITDGWVSLCKLIQTRHTLLHYYNASIIIAPHANFQQIISAVIWSALGDTVVKYTLSYKLLHLHIYTYYCAA